MKLHHNFLPAILIFATVLSASVKAPAQIVNEKTKKKFHVSVGMFTDIYMNLPSGIKTRTINQGFQAYVTYRVPFGKSNFGFAFGLGFSAHNMYGNFKVKSYSDSTVLQKNDTSYKRSKITMPYLELPIEFNFVTKYKFNMGLGFKIGYMLPAHTKYVGDDAASTIGEIRVKDRNVLNMDKFEFGPNLRVGYKWFNLFCYYQLSYIFQTGKGPDIYPITVGFLLRPF
jgi:hypothetical protein